MKIAISTAGKTVESDVELRFGRATSFMIYNTVSRTFTIVNNRQQLDAPQGAGIQSAGNVINSGADAVISGHCGPKAMKVLTSAGIKVYTTTAKTISQALADYETNSMEQLRKADVEGHWV